VVDETAVKINDDWYWAYSTLYLDTKVILDVALFKYYGTNPAAAFLHGLYEKHDYSQAVFLTGAFGYRTAFSRLRINTRIDYMGRNQVEKWFHTLKMRLDRLHSS
jgi:putative transposase